MAEKRILNRIKSVLADKGKTNLWLAEQLGNNKSTISKWCTNDQQPTLETLFDIAEILEVEVSELLVSRKK
jgi:transcriptional regulator with XRE-family HTH domain